MDERDWLAARFEENRSHLRGVAYRMLGRASDADDAVQEAWLRLARVDASAIENLGGWLTTVVARVCLDMLRSRTSRREDPLDPERPGAAAADRTGGPEDEVLLADSVGMAMLVVLETLGPAERLAFVLHDMFGVPFEEIGPIVGRTPAAARQLASRARRRVHGAPTALDPDLGRQREVVEAFLAAARGGDFAALLALLDPDVVMRVDAVAGRGEAREVRGAQAVAGGATRGGAREAQPALVDGQVGVVVAPLGQLMLVLRFTVQGRSIVAIDVVGEPERLAALELAVLDL